MLRLFVKTLGCKVNAIESEYILDELGHYHIEQVSDEAHAQIALVNTCSVTAEADAKTRKAIRKLASHPEIIDVIVTGCSAVMHPELADLDAKVRIVSDKTAVLEAIAEKHALEFSKNPEARSSSRARSFIKIQDGCENFCAYCIVPYARGACASLPYAEVSKHIAKEIKAGAHEVVLSGINIGKYQDKHAGIASLSELIQRILADHEFYRLRISSIEPPDIDDEFLELFASEPRICKHLHISLQSGSDAVLRAMNRRYTAAEYLEKIEAIRTRVPDCAITTDIIVGFPGESEEDFTFSLKLAEQAAFSQIHVFKYSRRTGTKAAEMSNQIDAETSSRRSKELRELGAQLSRAYAKRFAGRSLEIVIESKDESKVRGISEYYLRYEATPQALIDNLDVHLPNDTVSSLIEQARIGAIARIIA